MSDSTVRFVIDGKSVLPEAMPKVYRLLEAKVIALGDGLICCTATLYHRHLSPRVAWTCRKNDPRIRLLGLVSIRWNQEPTCEDGKGGELHIGALVAVETPDEATNLFDIVPPTFILDPALLERGRALFNQLPRHFKRLFNAVFRERMRFLWFVAGPASLHGRYAPMNGNLRRSIEVAESALRIAAGHREVFPALIILGSLLRDAGKAERYRIDPIHDRFVVSDDGQLVGHRLTAVEWLATAIAHHGIEIPKAHRTALMHILSSAPGAPEWLGLCEPQSLEASIIAMAERWLEHDADYGGAGATDAAQSWPARKNLLHLPAKDARDVTIGGCHD